MRKVLLIVSHPLTEDQKKELKEVWGVTEFVSLPPRLREVWSNIPPKVESLIEHLYPIYDWMRLVGSREDLAFIQGDPDATLLVVEWAQDLGLVPVYETLQRFYLLAKRGQIRLVTEKHGGIFLRKTSEYYREKLVRVLVLRYYPDEGDWFWTGEVNFIPKEDWESLEEYTLSFLQNILKHPEKRCENELKHPEKRCENEYHSLLDL